MGRHRDGPLTTSQQKSQERKALEEVNDYIQNNRMNMGKFIREPLPDDPDAQMLRVAACCLIFSATEEDFRCV